MRGPLQVDNFVNPCNGLIPEKALAVAIGVMTSNGTANGQVVTFNPNLPNPDEMPVGSIH
jgi:hypothetical protein